MPDNKQLEIQQRISRQYKNRQLQMDLPRGDEDEELFLRYHLNSDIPVDERMETYFTERSNQEIEAAKARRNAKGLIWVRELSPQVQLSSVKTIALPRRVITTNQPLEKLIQNRR